MLSEEHGNLLEAPADALVNTVNTAGIMGKGLALQFKQAYPGNFRACEAACRRGEVRLGKMFTCETGRLDRPRFVINFPIKGALAPADRGGARRYSWCPGHGVPTTGCTFRGIDAGSYAATAHDSWARGTARHDGELCSPQPARGTRGGGGRFA